MLHLGRDVRSSGLFGSAKMHATRAIRACLFIFLRSIVHIHIFHHSEQIVFVFFFIEFEFVFLGCFGWVSAKSERHG